MTKQPKMTALECRIDALWTALYSLRLPGLLKRYKQYTTEAMDAPNARAEWEAWHLRAIVNAYARKRFPGEWEKTLTTI